MLRQLEKGNLSRAFADFMLFLSRLVSRALRGTLSQADPETADEAVRLRHLIAVVLPFVLTLSPNDRNARLKSFEVVLYPSRKDTLTILD